MDQDAERAELLRQIEEMQINLAVAKAARVVAEAHLAEVQTSIHERCQAYRLDHGYDFVPMKVPIRKVEDMHDLSLSSESISASSLTLPEEDHHVVLETVVDRTFIEPSLLLSEGVNSSKEGPLVLLIDDVSVVCLPDPPSFKRSLEGIFLLELGGSHYDKFGVRSEKSTCAREDSWCSRLRLLKKDGWFELWTVHSGRYKLLREPG